MSGSTSTELPRIAALCGPTGTGKSDLAISLARRFPVEIVNFDSVQVYRGFDIGSAKPSAALREEIPHHLIDSVEPSALFTAADFAKRAEDECGRIDSRGRIPLLVGGTGFYLRALLAGMPELPERNEEIRERIRHIRSRKGGTSRLHRWLQRVDPVTAGRVAEPDAHRIERALEVWLTTGKPISAWPRPGAASAERYDARKYALSLPREDLNERLDLRVGVMYENGLIEETRALLERYSPDCRPFDAIGYREAVAFIRGEVSIDDAVNETRRRTRAYAKRQMTWLRNEKGIQWIDMTCGPEQALERIANDLEHWLENGG